MKKILSALLLFVLVMTVSGCTTDETNSTSQTTKNTTSTTTTSSTEPVVTTESTTTAELSEYDQFNQLFNTAAQNFKNKNSTHIIEKAVLSFKLNGYEFKNSITGVEQVVKEPFYASYSLNETYNDDSQSTNFKFFEIGDKVYEYLSIGSQTYSNEVTDFDFTNEELDKVLRNVPNSLDFVSNVRPNNDNRTLYTKYESTITIGDLKEEDQTLFNVLLDKFIGAGLYNIDTLKDVRIDQEIIIEPQTKQFYSIKFNIGHLISEASSQLGVTLTSPYSIYTFEFKDTDVFADESIKADAIIDDAPNIVLDYYQYKVLNTNNTSISGSLNHIEDVDMIKVEIEEAGKYLFNITANDQVYGNIYDESETPYRDAFNYMRELNKDIFAIELEAGVYYLSIENINAPMINNYSVSMEKIENDDYADLFFLPINESTYYVEQNATLTGELDYIGDVDFIEFEGNITITGAVTPGVKVIQLGFDEYANIVSADEYASNVVFDKALIIGNYTYNALIVYSLDYVGSYSFDLELAN